MDDSQEFGEVLEALELAAYTIAHNAVVEQIYVNQGLLTASLRATLVTLYAAVLQVLVEARKYYGKDNLGKFIRLTPT